jgi:hypothetical protein
MIIIVSLIEEFLQATKKNPTLLCMDRDNKWKARGHIQGKQIRKHQQAVVAD